MSTVSVFDTTHRTTSSRTHESTVRVPLSSLYSVMLSIVDYLRLQCTTMADSTDETVTASKPEVFYNYRERIKCSPEEDAQLERQHFWKVINAFKYYR